MLPARPPTAPVIALAMVLSQIAFTADASAETLYEELGAKPGLTAIIADTLAAGLADPRIHDKLDDINIERLTGRIVEMLCELTGGPCHFHGVGMKGAHGYLELHDFHFNALVEDLQTAMDKADIPFRTQNRLLALLAPMRRDIVTK